ncbi:MAG: AAA family ATPase [Nanoarchaeota archaeon]|nr:AAA family ATPase [Nanoarchaeota archaeon]
MRKICVINQKGGVGKTTTAVNLAVGLANAGKKVLILDLDPQGNINSCLPAESKKDIYDLLVENAKLNECTVQLNENLAIVPSRETLTKAELILVGEQSRETVLKRKLEKLSGYDYVLIDCPPSLGLLNQNAMIFADEAIIPASTDLLGLDGLRKITAALKKINEVFDHDIDISVVVPTMHDSRTKVCREVLKQMNKDFFGIVAEPIRINSKLKEAPGMKQSIFEYAKSSNGAKDYGKLVEMVLNSEKSANGYSVNRQLENANGKVLYKVASAD